jgi:hypothetical protein
MQSRSLGLVIITNSGEQGIREVEGEEAGVERDYVFVVRRRLRSE